MNYNVNILKDNVLPLPDTLCSELGFAVGDILICEMDKSRSQISMSKHTDQTLTDEQILVAGNLTRVISISTKE
jgi:hypothetical protein